MAVLSHGRAFTREQIEEAKQDRSHPAIKVFDSLQRNWDELRYNLRGATLVQDQHELCADGVVPFSQALEGKTFTLEPLEIVSIWSRAMEIHDAPVYFGYELSKSLACAYCVIPIASRDWIGVYEWMERDLRHLEGLARKDTPNTEIFTRRLAQIQSNLGLLDHYSRPEEEVRPEMIGGKQEDGFPMAQQQWHSDETLSAVHENWGNGLSVIFVELELAQRAA